MNDEEIVSIQLPDKVLETEEHCREAGNGGIIVFMPGENDFKLNYSLFYNPR